MELGPPNAPSVCRETMVRCGRPVGTAGTMGCIYCLGAACGTASLCGLPLLQPEARRSIGCCLSWHVSRERVTCTLARLHACTALCCFRCSVAGECKSGMLRRQDAGCSRREVGQSRTTTDRRYRCKMARGFWAAGLAWRGIARAAAGVRTRGLGVLGSLDGGVAQLLRGFQQFQGCGRLSRPYFCAPSAQQPAPAGNLD